MPDNSTAEDLRTAAMWVETGAIGFTKEYADQILSLERRVLGYADTLDALREAVKPNGCTNPAPCPGGTTKCGYSFDDDPNHVAYFCERHAGERDRALVQLLGKEPSDR